MPGVVRDEPLGGVHCLLLRPPGQERRLSELIVAEGGVVTYLPTIEIEPVSVPAADLARLEAADWIVFISPNAVQCGLAALHRAGRPLPASAAIAAVGAGTARALQERDVRVDAQPAAGGGADALLAHPRLARLNGCRVLIVRGVGGRERLAEGLREHGAGVVYLEVYRRALPTPRSPAPGLEDWRRAAARVTIVTSETGWRHLLELIDEPAREAVFTSALVAVSRRVADAARALGHRGPAAIAAEPGPEGLVAGVRQVTEVRG